METRIKLHDTIEKLLAVVLDLPEDGLSLLSLTENRGFLFKDLYLLGCDLFELIRMFVQSDGLCAWLCEFILSTVEPTNKLDGLSIGNLSVLIPHWTSSKYHTASKKEVLQDIQFKIKNSKTGGYVYNSNLNVRNSKAYNDLYILIISEEKSLFIDVNRRKIHGFSRSIGYNKD